MMPGFTAEFSQDSLNRGYQEALPTFSAPASERVVPQQPWGCQRFTGFCTGFGGTSTATDPQTGESVTCSAWFQYPEIIRCGRPPNHSIQKGCPPCAW